VDDTDKRAQYRLLEALLRDLGSSDEKKASLACSKLMAKSEPFLRGYFYTMLNHEDLEDVLQQTRINIWNARQVVSRLTAAAWPNYVRNVAHNCARDLWRKQSQDGPKLEEAIQMSKEHDREAVERFMAALTQDDSLASFLHSADRLWLGLSDGVSAQIHRRQVLAAQFYYLDDEPLPEIVALLPPAPGESRLTPTVLQEWLTHPGVIRALAYHQLLYTSDRLAWYLLGKHGPVNLVELDALTGAACGLGAPVTPEVAVILWRYRYGMRPDDILARKDCPLDREQLKSLLVILEGRVPFNFAMETLTCRLNQKLGTDQGAQILGTAGLWQRLAFQYHYVLGPMPLTDICARLTAPAQQVGYKITQSNVNMWLSGKRMITSLARFIAHQPDQQSYQQGETNHD
jgi:hypothetical protein